MRWCVCGLGYHYGCVIMHCTRIHPVSIGDTEKQEGFAGRHAAKCFETNQFPVIKDFQYCIRIPLE